MPIAPTPDLMADVLKALSGLTLAEAQECFVCKAVNGEQLAIVSVGAGTIFWLGEQILNDFTIIFKV